jgi:hypothetical protein
MGRVANIANLQRAREIISASARNNQERDFQLDKLG